LDEFSPGVCSIETAPSDASVRAAGLPDDVIVLPTRADKGSNGDESIRARGRGGRGVFGGGTELVGAVTVAGGIELVTRVGGIDGGIELVVRADTVAAGPGGPLDVLANDCRLTSAFGIAPSG
jgi:hypothetical protein